MSKNTKIAITCFVAASAMLMSGCKKTTQVQPAERVVEEVDIETGIIELRPLHGSDTLSINGRNYTYRYDFHRNDSLPIVRNPQGIDYYDNEAHLIVTCDDKEIVNKTYTLASLTSYIPESFHQNAALVGFTYNYAKTDDHSALYFIITVGDPDETADMVYPMELKVSPDGSIDISKAVNLETEPVQHGMTIDPSTDGGI